MTNAENTAPNTNDEAPNPTKASKVGTAQECPAKAILVQEKHRPLTAKRLEMLRAAYDKWWAAAHENDPAAYARAKSDLYTFVAEYLPELLTHAENSLKWQDQRAK